MSPGWKRAKEVSLRSVHTKKNKVVPVDAKGESIPKRTMPDIVNDAMEQEKVKFTFAALVCPLYRFMTPKRRQRLGAIMSNWRYTTVNIAFTTLALMAADLLRWLGTEREVEWPLEIMQLVAFLLLLVDLVAQSTMDRKFVYSGFWFMDFFATFAVLLDLDLILGITMTKSSSTATALTISRAGRSVARVLKMVRLVRMMDSTVFNKFKCQCLRKKPTEAKFLQERQVSVVGNKIASIIRLKITVVAVVIILVFSVLGSTLSEDVEAQLDIMEPAVGTAAYPGVEAALATRLDIVKLVVDGVDVRVDEVAVADDRLSTAEVSSSSGRIKVYVDVTDSERAEAGLALLLSNFVLLMLVVQAMVLTHAVDTMLVHPLERILEYLKPVMNNAITEVWSKTEAENKGETLTTQLILAGIATLKTHLKAEERVKFNKKGFQHKFRRHSQDPRFRNLRRQSMGMASQTFFTAERAAELRETGANSRKRMRDLSAQVVMAIRVSQAFQSKASGNDDAEGSVATFHDDMEVGPVAGAGVPGLFKPADELEDLGAPRLRARRRSVGMEPIPDALKKTAQWTSFPLPKGLTKFRDVTQNGVVFEEVLPDAHPATLEDRSRNPGAAEWQRRLPGRARSKSDSSDEGLFVDDSDEESDEDDDLDGPPSDVSGNGMPSRSPMAAHAGAGTGLGTTTRPRRLTQVKHNSLSRLLQEAEDLRTQDAME